VKITGHKSAVGITASLHRCVTQRRRNRTAVGTPLFEHATQASVHIEQHDGSGTRAFRGKK
jgi:hypothetical protein